MKSKTLACLALLSSVAAVIAQTSTFTYQGQLSADNAPANGQFDLRFALVDSATNQVGAPLTNSAVGVTNGIFTVTLNFGAGVFDGNARWLEIGVRTNGSTNAFAILTPRQPITSAPYAIRAANLSGTLAATNLTGTVPDTNLSANVAFLNKNANFTGSVSATQFNGSGAGLTSVPAESLTGTVSDARLSTNVAFVNTSNAIFKGAVTATNFYGNGHGLTNVPGRIGQTFPVGANVQAAATYGYLATNNATAVVVTLPPTAAIDVGATIRVSGSGAAGWIIAQNAGQVIQVANLTDNVGFAWRTNETGRLWDAVASSTDGSKLVAVVNGGQIYASTNYGATWPPGRDSNRAWSAVASSADGMKLVAVVNGGVPYTSADAGTNWTPRSPSLAWSGVASSLDGVKLVATVSGSGSIYTSENSGVNWTARFGPANWTACASSGNGSNMVATAQGGQIYTSTNGGLNWVARDSNRAWSCVASSGDGSRLIAGVNPGSLYVSPDFGATWIPVGASTTWTAVGCSADGLRMIAVASGGGVYVSTDNGITWAQRPNLPTSVAIFTGATVSGDGSTMVAVANSNPLYISSQATTTVGTAGYLAGSRLSAVELQHVGNGVFIPISYAGSIRAQ